MQPSISASFVPLEPIFEQSQPIVVTAEDQQQQSTMSKCELDAEHLLRTQSATRAPDLSQLQSILGALQEHLQIVQSAPTVQAIGTCSHLLSCGMHLANLWREAVATKVKEWSKDFALAANGLSRSANKDFNYEQMPTEFEKRLSSIRHDASSLVATIDQLHNVAGGLLHFTSNLNVTERQLVMGPENEIKESKRKIEAILKALLQHCFLVYNQPPQVIKRDKNFGISFKLLVAEALMKCYSVNRVLKIDEKLTLSILTEHNKNWLLDPRNTGQELHEPQMGAKQRDEQPRFGMGERTKRSNEEDAADGGKNGQKRASRRRRSASTNEEPIGNGGGWSLEGACAVNNRCSLDTLANGLWMLKLRHTRIGKPGGDNAKADPPFYHLVGECRVAIVGEETSWVPLRAFSLPMLLPVGNEQLERYELSVFWRNAFGNQQAVPWDLLCSEISRLFKAQTGRAPNKSSYDYLKSKALIRASNQHQITRSDLEKRVLPGQNFPLWRWLHKVKRLLCTTDSTLDELWRGGHIYGFVSKERAAELLKHYSTEHPNIGGFILIRFSESTLDALSVSAIASGGEAKHVKPWSRDQLKKGEEELRRRLAEEFRHPENFALIPSESFLSSILEKGHTRQPVLVQTENEGYDEHLHFGEAPIRSLSFGINGSPRDSRLNFNPVAFSGVPEGPTSWNQPYDRCFAGVSAGPLKHFDGMGMTSPAPVSSMFGGSPSLDAFRNASSRMSVSPLNGQSIILFGQTTEVLSSQLSPPQPALSNNEQLATFNTNSARDFASNLDSGTPSPASVGSQLSGNMKQANSLPPMQTLPPFEKLTIQQQHSQDMSSFTSQMPFTSSLLAQTTTSGPSFVPNTSTLASPFNSRAASQSYQPNSGNAASNSVFHYNSINQLNGSVPYHSPTPMLPNATTFQAPAPTPSPAF